MIENDDTTFMAYTPTVSPQRGEDGDSEVMRKTIAAESLPAGPRSTPNPALEELEDEVVDDGVDSQAVLEDETQDALANVLNSHKN